MSSPHKQPPARVPTLTEVVALDAAMPGAPPVPGSDTGGAQDLAERMAEDLRPWVDSMFEQRLREALASGVEALMPKLLAQLRGEFDALLREALTRALAQGPLKPP